jgi:VWFA-related protein
MMSRQNVRVAIGFLAVTVVYASAVAAQPIERSMWVSVVDQAGAPVAGLGPTDFVVREDNVSREILRVVPAQEPMQIALLVDTSQAVRNDIANVRNALPAFITTLTRPNEAGRRNEIALIGFGDRPTTLTDYTNQAAALQKGIGRLFPTPGSGPYLLDAIEESAKTLKKREAVRPVIVAIAMEGRELSYRSYEFVIESLKNTNAPLYALMIGTPHDDLTDEGRSRQIVLDRGTSETGGRRDQLLTSMALDVRLKQLGDQLTHMYQVVYAHPDTLIPPEKITVTAKNAELTARGTVARDQRDKRKP